MCVVGGACAYEGVDMGVCTSMGGVCVSRNVYVVCARCVCNVYVWCLWCARMVWAYTYVLGGAAAVCGGLGKTGRPAAWDTPQ